MIKSEKQILILGAGFLFLAVMLGAFGAHGLEKTLSEKYLATFKTGVQYQYYHGFGLLFLGVIQKIFQINLTKVALIFCLGVLLFSFNCYLYAVTGIKTFAMIVPAGGIAFLMGWFALSFKIFKEIK